MINNSTPSQWLRQPSPWTQPPWQSSPWTTSPRLHNITTNSSVDYYVHLCGDVEATTEKVVYSIFMIILLLCSLLGNTVVVSALLLSNKLTQRSTFYFVASLAVSDMVMATFQIPFRISVALHNMNWCLNLPTCYIRVLFDAFGNMGSILNLFLVSTDRFIAVQLPFRYDSLLSKGKAKVIIALAWLIAGCWSLVGIVQWNSQSQLAINVVVTLNDDGTEQLFCLSQNENHQLVGFTIYSIVLVIMCGQYVRILKVVLRQIRDIAKNTPQYKSSPDNRQRSMKTIKQSSPTNRFSPLNKTPSPRRDRASSQNPEDRKRDSRGSRGSTDLVNRIRFSTDASKKRWSAIALKIKDYRKEMKATKTIALVFLAFCLCWLPSTIITYIAYFDNEILLEMSTRTKKIIFFSLIDIFPMINTMINPVIYSFSNTQFRSAVGDIWRKLHGKAPKRGSIFTSAASQGTRLSYCPRNSASGHSAKENLLAPH